MEQKEQADLDAKNEAKAFKRGIKLLKREEVRRVPIIAFTEMASQEDLRLYMEIGMDGCVSKPLNEQALLATMTAAIPHHVKPAPNHEHSRSSASYGGRSSGDQQLGVRCGIACWFLMVLFSCSPFLFVLLVLFVLLDFGSSFKLFFFF